MHESNKYIEVFCSPRVNGVDYRGDLCRVLSKHQFSLEASPEQCKHELLHTTCRRDHSSV